MSFFASAAGFRKLAKTYTRGCEAKQLPDTLLQSPLKPSTLLIKGDDEMVNRGERLQRNRCKSEVYASKRLQGTGHGQDDTKCSSKASSDPEEKCLESWTVGERQLRSQGRDDITETSKAQRRCIYERKVRARDTDSA